MKHPHIQFVLDGHEALQAKDIVRIRAMFAPEILWHEFGDRPLGGRYRGVDEVMDFWKTYFQAAGDTFRQDIVSILANDAFVSTIVELTIHKGGRRHSQRAIDVMRMQGGKIAEFWRYYEDVRAMHEHLLADA
jgi:ketosteroid isomerase-like protein